MNEQDNRNSIDIQVPDYPPMDEQARQDAILAFIQCERTHRKIMDWLHNVSL